MPYEIADFRCELHTTEVGVPTLWWRSVGHTHTGYAVECFVDELLQAAGQDPVAGRLAMMGKQPRAAGVLRAVAELARWSGPGPTNGRARGVAVVESFGSFVAQIAEVSAGDSDGPRVHKVWCAVDCGVAVNPDVIRAQMEGGIGYGLGHALFAEVDAGRGPAGAGEFRHLPLAAHPRDAGGGGHDRALDRKADRRRRAGRAADRPAVANAMARLGLEPAATSAGREGDGVMRARTAFATAASSLGVAGAALLALQPTAGQPQPAAAPAASAETLRPLSAFAGIADPRARSMALFQEAGKVITHPRCVNCHPATERPLQTDRRRPHQPLVVRGADGHGAPGLALRHLSSARRITIPPRVPGHPRVASGAGLDGVGGQDARPDLRADQGPGAQRRQGHGGAHAAHGGGHARRLGLVARPGPHAGAGNASGVRRAHARLGRRRRALPSRVAWRHCQAALRCRDCLCRNYR